MNNFNEKDFYSRQINLPEVGNEGQAILKKSRVLIVGLGGLGHPVAQYLAAAGIGTLDLCDFDEVTSSNLNRQILFTPSDVGEKKVLVVAEKLKKQNPWIEVGAFPIMLTGSNAHTLIPFYDLVVDCTDNLETKFLIHDLCFQYKINLVQGAIDQWEGQIQVFRKVPADFAAPKSAGTSPCLRCLWETVPENKCASSCAEAGVMGVTAGIVGVMQANEVIKTLLGLETLNAGETFIINLLNLQTRKIKWKKNSECVLCKNEKTNFYDLFFSEKVPADFEVIDLEKINAEEIKIDSGKKYLFKCRTGFRAKKIVERLKQEGQNNVWSQP